MGPITQTIRLTVEAAKTIEVEVPVQGKVVSDIMLIGGGLRSETNSVSLGTLPRDEGGKVSLRVMVKGPHRDSVQLRIGDVEPPDILRASIGEAKKIGDGTIYLYPLNVEVAKDAPPINRLGTKQGRAGKITIETTHPTAKKVLLYVLFATR